MNADKWTHNYHLKHNHVPEIESLFSKRQKVKAILVFPIAQLHNKKAMAYIIRVFYLYGHIK